MHSKWVYLNTPSAQLESLITSIQVLLSIESRLPLLKITLSQLQSFDITTVSITIFSPK